MKHECSRCGHMYDEHFNFCPICGKATSESNDNSKILIVREDELGGSLGLGFLLVLLLGVVGGVIAACVCKKQTKIGAVAGMLIWFTIVVVLLIIRFVKS